MTAGATQLEYRPLRAPREDRTVLVEPPLDRVGDLVDANRRLRGTYQVDFRGRLLAELSRQAKAELVAEAVRFTTSYRDVHLPPFEPTRPIYLAGHQPQLFHPGVWFKNFALGILARQCGAVPINLLIDSDAIRTAAIRVPGGTLSRPNVALVPMDDSGPIVPFEERQILRCDVFRRFGRRAADQLAPLVPDPLVRDYWPLAVERAASASNLGECLAQARHRLEGQWGLETLELPQSRVCNLPAFAWFTAYVLAELPRFAAAYNAAVEEYRQVHRVRNAAHPVPNLAAEENWLEAPFWIWTADDPRRRRLFVKAIAGELRLTDRQSLEVRLPLGPGGDIARAAERLMGLAGERIRIRSRALTTTLWARLVLGDLFLHGIGGAKYDQVTDSLMERLFALQPPGILVLSATIQLPIPRKRVSARDLAAIRERLRALEWHPETAISNRPCPGRCRELDELIAAKSRWVGTAPTRENARLRWREIRRINQTLQSWLTADRQRLLERRAETASALRAEAVLASREYSFCLYPERTLREFFAEKIF